jgi:hypothetical protein
MENFGELSKSLAWEGFHDAGIDDPEPNHPLGPRPFSPSKGGQRNEVRNLSRQPIKPRELTTHPRVQCGFGE